MKSTNKLKGVWDFLVNRWESIVFAWPLLWSDTPVYWMATETYWATPEIRNEFEKNLIAYIKRWKKEHGLKE